MRSFLAVAFLIAFIGCTRSSAPGNRVIAEVGSYRIAQRDAELRDRVLRVYYPEEKRQLGAKLLVDAYVMAEVLRQNGQPVTDAALMAEERRIDAQSKDPARLGLIREIFAGDQEAFRRVFVLPTYAGRVLRFEFFPAHPPAHASARREAEEFVRRVQAKPGEFEKLARARGSEVQRAERLDGAPEDLVGLAKGQVHGALIDRGENWIVARRGSQGIEWVTFAKAPFDPWFEAEKAKIRVIRPRLE